MTAERTLAVSAIKGILDTDRALRNRFQVCSRTRRSTSAEEVSNWQEVLLACTGERYEKDEVRVALSRLTVLLLPTSDEARAIIAAGRTGEAPTAPQIVVFEPDCDTRASITLAPDPANLPALDAHVNARLVEDRSLRRAFDCACDEMDSRAMAQVAYALYREVIPEDSAAARRGREHKARMSEIEERLFPRTEHGQHIDEILAALDRTAAREAGDGQGSIRRCPRDAVKTSA